MSAASTIFPQSDARWELPSRGRVGMSCLIAAEAAIFTIFVVAYLFYVGKSPTGPAPKDVLHAPIVFTICLFSSSLTVRFAEQSLNRGKSSAFAGWWLLTIVFGAFFLFGTGREWRRLIMDEGLTISTNLFGTTYYSLVGLHAFHVVVGLIALMTVALLGVRGHIGKEHAERVSVLSMYWHFVDAVWVVVFTVVYVIGV